MPAILRQNGAVTPQDFAKQRADHHLLDVREDDEWQAGHIEGAQHIPLGQLGARLGEVPKGRRVVAVCRSGSRSAAAVRGLKQQGYDAENLDGGVTAWSKAGLGLVDDAGRPGRVI
ncbi:MAG TPA: rhodanese-like domain-containing protein [Candidatus Limnocylindria bacterium]|jgi:rhodanese-related sulfurtransferase